MVESMKVNGRTACSMERENTKAKTVFGSKVVGNWVNV